MRNALPILILACLLSSYVFAQNEGVVISNAVKKNIGFIPYTDPSNADKKYRELTYKNIYDAALRVFVNTQRFTVLDRGSFDIIKIEKEFQKGEDLANSEIISQGRVSAAELLAVAKISTFTITESDDGDGYSVYISAEFKQLDVKTGEATMAYQLVAEAKDKQGGDVQIIKNKRIPTIEEAISIAVRKMEDDLARWIKGQWPLILKIIDVEDKKQRVVIEGGKDVGLSKSHKMKAVTLKVYEKTGKKLIDTIGKLNYTREGIGEELTPLKMSSKKDWESFLKLWNENPDRIYVTEDL